MSDEKNEEVLEIEIQENEEINIPETVVEETQEAEPAPAETASEDKEFSKRVQKRISTLVQQRKQAEAERDEREVELNTMKTRLDRLEHGNNAKAQQDFEGRYQQARASLQTAIEQGNTEAQVALQEQMTDMRAAMRVAEMQKQQRVSQSVSPTVGRAAQVESEPTPTKAIDWWQKNRWFNSEGFERETAAARAIDIQLDVEGYDKESEDYYETLNNRLKIMFPELISGSKVETTTRQRAKSRSPVAPTAGGPSRKGNRVKMTKDQLSMARELGITDDKSLKAYAAEIQATQETNNG
jgi:hypothetical protein